MILLTKLLLAHLLGDFILQPHHWVMTKEKKKFKAWQLYAHTVIHGVLIMLLLWDFKYLIPCIIITISHGLIDSAKLLFQKNTNKRFWFFLDQVLHLLIILVVWYFIETPRLNFSIINTPKFIIFFTALVLISIPASVLRVC